MSSLIKTLADIFSNTEAESKITVIVATGNDVTITYTDMDEEWAKELMAAGALDWRSSVLTAKRFEHFQFTCHERFEVKDRGWCYSVPNPIDTSDFSELIGTHVVINGELVKVLGVERFAHSPPWYKGELIGLLTRERV